jgi:hypothetical protein
MAKVTQLKPQPVVMETSNIVIKAPNFAVAAFAITGTAPYLQNNFSSDNKNKMVEKQKEGTSQTKKRRAKPPKDFQRVYEGSMHIAQEGWHGIPASSLRHAMIDACRLTEVDMVRAKMCIFIEADGLDKDSLQPLVRINGKPRMLLSRVKIGMNQTDIAARAVFEKWDASVRIRWDADLFSPADIGNLLARAGWQVGIGAGRPLSKTSPGMGYGTFDVKQ